MNKKQYEEPRLEKLDTAFLQTYEGTDSYTDTPADTDDPINEDDNF